MSNLRLPNDQTCTIIPYQIEKTSLRTFNRSTLAQISSTRNTSEQEPEGGRMKGIYVPSKGPEDWRKLLGDPEMHWREGFSAMALANRWEDSNGVPAEIA